MSSDTSDEGNLDLLREATDNDFFKNSFYNKEGNEKVEEEKKIKPSLRVKDEYDQFRLFNVTPQFQKYVGNVLSDKLEKYLEENSVECCGKKRKKKKLPNAIKLLNTSKYPIDLESNEEENSDNKSKRIKPEVKSICVSESELKSIVITGEEILCKKGTEFWSNRSKAPIFRYSKDKKGTLTLIEPDFK